VTSTDVKPSELTKWDPGITQRVMGITRPFLKRYFRSEVRGLDNVPAGGALVVCNHSGGLLPTDVPILAAEFYHEHGYDRPIYTLSHDMIMTGPTGDFFKRIGYISANHENADEALRSGGLVVVFPGGEYDVYRPTLTANKIDFGGRTGYIKAALNAGCRSCPRWASAVRRPRSSSPAAPGWPSGWDLSRAWHAPRSCRSRSASRSG
jgi:1-acyl-sn-glycerol-3-phosphate acyltransferase